MFVNALKIVLILLLTSCAISPTGRQQFIAVSSEQLNLSGSLAFSELKQTRPIARDPHVNRYVNCVTQLIVNELAGGPAWEVVVFRDRSANAFALPGGKIGVNTGLLQVARTQDQLAAVIAHEVGHVLADHANERLSQRLAIEGGLSLLGAVAGASEVSPVALQALGIGAQVGVLLPYSRIHESEADLIGLDLMARAGFDPRESISLWQNMQLSGDREPPEFLSSHPSHGTRIQELRGNIGPALQVYQASLQRGKRPRCG